MRRIAIFLSKTTNAERLTGIVEDRGDHVVGIYGVGRHRRGWKDMLKRLDKFDQIVVGNVSDIPVKSLNELLSALAFLHEADVSLVIASTGIDALASPASSLLDLMVQFRRARRSQAIQNGQAKACAAGKKIGRPEVPPKLRQRIAAAVLAGDGVRPTAKRFGVSPGTVINISRSTLATAVAA